MNSCRRKRPAERCATSSFYTDLVPGLRVLRSRFSWLSPDVCRASVAPAMSECKMDRNSDVSPHPIDVHVGRRIRRRRWLVGLTQADLGRAVGLAPQQIHKYESGVNRVSASRLVELAHALHTSASYFFDEMGIDDDLPLDNQDIWTERETMLLLRAFARMSGPARRQLLGLLRDIQTRR